MPEQRVNILVYRPDGTLIAQYLLGDGEHLIGRDINCPVYLDSEHISSNHAKLHLSPDGIYIEDLNSTSGTYLDGVTVRGKLRIKPGQVLQVGDLTVDLQPESVDNVGPGSRLGGDRYTLIRLLGRGGMGEVWLAKDEQLEEEVALKKLPPEVAADAMALSDMRREVQKSRGLSHPNIIRIHDLLQQPGEDPLISLEYVDGRDLTAIADAKTNGIFSWEEIKGWMLQLISALEYAHYEKIVHRDLKPANIMITRDGRLKLADFGIAATLVDSLSRSSMEGFVSGTTLYMSPQQMEGEVPQTTDDIYAFGATVYELLSSKPPFYTGNVEHQVLNVTPKPMDQRLAEFGFTNEIPGYANQLVMACLAKEPEGRPQGMAAIREWIESEGAAKEVMPKPSTKTVKKLAEPAQAKRTNYALVAIALALVVGLGIWLKGQIESLGGGQPPVQVSKLPKENTRVVDPGETNNPTAQPTNSTTTPEVPPKPAAKKGATTNPEPVKPNPTVTQPVKPTNPATTGKERLLWEFKTGGQIQTSAAIGADGTVYIGPAREGEGTFRVYALDGATGAKKWEFVTGGFVSSTSIGADGTVYFGSRDKKVYALNPDGTKKWEFVRGSTGVNGPAIGSDGTVYIGSRKIYALNGKTGTKKWEFEMGRGVKSSPAVGADGTVYVGSTHFNFYALDGATGAKKWEFVTGNRYGVDSSPAIGADGTVYFGAEDTKVYALNGKSGVKLWEFKTGGSVASSPAIGPDGTVYVGSGYRANKLYAINPKSGVKLWEFETGGGVPSSPAIGSDGTVYVGSLDKMLYAINGKSGDKLWAFETGGSVSSAPAIGPDGTLYIGSLDGKLYALRTDSKGPAKSPWPMRGQNPQHTGRASSTKTSVAAPVSPNPVTPQSLKKGLTGYYPFNGNAKDESGNNFHGTLQELYKLTTDQRGAPNSAYQFNGELGFIIIPATAHQNTKEKGTVSLWYKTTSEGTRGTLFHALSSGFVVNRRIGLSKDGTVSASIENDRGALGSRKTVNGTWNHVCMLWRNNNDRAEFYVNGLLAGKNSNKYWNESSPDWIRIATDGNYHSGRLNVTIGDLRFYNRDLSAAEVKALYEFEKAKE